MQPGDVELETADGKITSILAVLEEMKARWPSGDDARSRAKSYERWVWNRFSGAGGFGFESHITAISGAPMVNKNKLRSLVLTYAARITKRRDTALAYGNEASVDDIAVAQAANAILDYLRQLQDRDTLMMQAVIKATIAGTVGIYTPFDPDMGPFMERVVKTDQWGFPQRDQAGNILYEQAEGKGNPTVEILSIHDYVTSGEQLSHKGKWALIRRWMDPDEAASILRDKAAETGERVVEPSITLCEGRHGSRREAVEGYEMWWRPNKRGRFPDGFFATVVSGVAISAVPFPYDHREIPLVTLRTMDPPDDDYYGSTWLEDAVPQQMGLNHHLQVLAHRSEVAGQVRIIAKPMIAQAWGDANDGIIEATSADDVNNGAKVIETPDIPSDMYTMSDKYEQGIDDVSGIGSVSSSGDTAAQTKNAKLVAYATQIDELKNEHPLRNLEQAELAIDAQHLKLFQQYVPQQRLIRVIGEDRSVSAAYFSGAEIRGVDVQLYAAPGSQRTKMAKAQAAEEGTAAGFIDPATGAELRETGLDGTVAEGEQRQKAHALIQRALAGEQVQADITITPEVAVAEIEMALGSPGLDPNAVMPLQALLQQYTELAAQGAQQEMPTDPAAQQGGKPPKAIPQQSQVDQLPTGVQ